MILNLKVFIFSFSFRDNRRLCALIFPVAWWESVILGIWRMLESNSGHSSWGWWWLWGWWVVVGDRFVSSLLRKFWHQPERSRPVSEGRLWWRVHSEATEITRGKGRSLLTASFLIVSTPLQPRESGTITGELLLSTIHRKNPVSLVLNAVVQIVPDGAPPAAQNILKSQNDEKKLLLWLRSPTGCK